ncbi:MAG: hypothetical protein JXD23_11245 [Spirochaetales bacterium]|nr:hypothetical protein [Spirochaetales bacterium]
MRKMAFVILLALCFFPEIVGAESKFKFAPGTAILGGGISVNMLQSFNDNPISVLTLRVRPRFGSFITKDTMLFSFCDFQFDADFNHHVWNGGLDLGAQGRFYFSTEGAADFYIGLQAAFGLSLTDNFGNLQEHVTTGVVLGLFVPLNEKVAFDFSLDPIFYIPLNTYMPFAMFSSLTIGIVSAL